MNGQILTDRSASPPCKDDVMALIREAAPKVGRHTVGFAKLRQSNGSNQTVPVLSGTGVLVKSSGRFAILSAEHVLGEVTKHPEFELAGFSVRPHHQVLNSASLDYVILGKAGVESDGPDLGLLFIPPADARRLEESGPFVFYNLDKHAEVVKRDPPAEADNGYMVCGLVGEWSDAPLEDTGNRMLKQFRGLVWSGRCLAHEHRGNLDFVTLDVNYCPEEIRADHMSLRDGPTCEPDEMPSSLKGMSGAGLWQIRAIHENSKTLITQILLCGTAFYQTERKDGHRKLICHGYRSIYQNVIEAMWARSG